MNKLTLALAAIAGVASLAACTPVLPMPPGAKTVNLWSVVDGDTIKTSVGTVRVIGIDTPERGQCGYAQATTAMKRLTMGKVTLVPVYGMEDRDRYGRLLRYVEVGGVDVGLAQIKSGMAIARYDSRDGYGAHPREADYVSADAASPNACATTPAAPPPAPAPAPAPVPTTTTPSAGPSPRFATCREAKAAGYGPYTRGQVEYGWYRDADGDGVVCE